MMNYKNCPLLFTILLYVCNFGSTFNENREIELNHLFNGIKLDEFSSSHLGNKFGYFDLPLFTKNRSKTKIIKPPPTTVSVYFYFLLFLSPGLLSSTSIRMRLIFIICFLLNRQRIVSNFQYQVLHQKYLL